MPDTLGIYIHIPFCQKRCSYCDFNTYAGIDELKPAYVTALCEEIENAAKISEASREVDSIFFGGGTPSVLSSQAIDTILKKISHSFKVSPQAEISLEANPGAVSPDYLKAIHDQGINRLSLGMQSALAHELLILERIHSLEDVENAIDWSRKAGFDNLNLDLMFGLPGQKLSDWKHNLSVARSYEPEHIALYALTIEENTLLDLKISRGDLPAPDDDQAADMYEYTMDTLENLGYHQYEISNWAKMDASGKLYESRHNKKYWYTAPYLGFGAGAHSNIQHLRYANVLHPRQYIQKLNNPDSMSAPFPKSVDESSIIQLDEKEEMQETMMMGLRLTIEGVSDSRFRERYGAGILDVFGKEVQDLSDKGLVEWNQFSVKLTHRGRMLGNQVFLYFV